MVGLVGDQRAQGVDEQARLARGESPFGRMQLEGERLAAARGHDGQGRLALGQGVEHGLLGREQVAVANEGRHDLAAQLVGAVGGKLLPLGAIALAFLFQTIVLFGVVGAVGAEVRIAFGIHFSHVVAVFARNKGFECTAGLHRGDRRQHGLHRPAPPPFVDLHFEGGVDHAVAAHELVDVGAVEHDARHRMHAVGEGGGKVVLVGAHRARPREGDVAGQVTRLAVFLPEGGQGVEGFHVFQRELAQIDDGVDVDARVEAARGQGIHVGAQAVGKLAQAVGRQGHAHGGLVPAETGEDVLAAFHRFEEVDLAHAAARPAGHSLVVDREEDAGHPVAAHQARGHDTLHAFVPALAAHHEGALAVVDLLGLQARDFGELGFDRPALGIDLFEHGGLAARGVEIVFQEQVERHRGIAHAASGVQARDQAEGQRGGGHRFVGGAGGGQKGGDAGSGRVVHASDAVGGEGTVARLHGHEVGHGAQSREIGVFAPQVGLTEAGAEYLHELQGHAHAGQNAALAIGVELGVADRHPLGDEVGRFVMVGDEDPHPAVLERAHLFAAGDAAVDGDHHVGLAGHEAIDRRLGDAVAFVGAARDEGNRRGAQGAQTAREHRSGRHAVDVEVAEDQDALAVADGRFEPVGHFCHTGDVVGVAPIAFERRVQKLAGFLGRFDAAGDQGSGNDVGNAKRAFENVDHGRVDGANVETCGQWNQNLIRAVCLSLVIVAQSHSREAGKRDTFTRA